MGKRTEETPRAAGKRPKPESVRKQQFREHVERSSDDIFEGMCMIADSQQKHPDHANRCWAGSNHVLPFLDVIAILQAEKERRKTNV